MEDNISRERIDSLKAGHEKMDKAVGTTSAAW
jgi:hypothetical protein